MTDTSFLSTSFGPIFPTGKSTNSKSRAQNSSCLREFEPIFKSLHIVFAFSELATPLSLLPTHFQLAIFVFGMLFEVIFALDAARLKNTIQCIGVSVFNVALIITASLEISQVRDAIRNQDEASGYNFLCDPSDQNSRKVCDLSNTLYPTVEKFLIVVPVIVGLAQIPITILTWRLHTEFGWLIYKKLGADLSIRKMFLWYQVSRASWRNVQPFSPSFPSRRY